MMDPGKHFTLIFTFLLAAFCAQSTAWAAQAIPENNLRYPVLLTLDDGSTASGFYFNYEAKDLFFVTAKHVLFRKDETGVLKAKSARLLSYPLPVTLTEPVSITLDLELLNRNGLISVDPEKDVAVIRLTNGEKIMQTVDLVDGVVKDKGFQGSLGSAGMETVKKFDDILPSNEVFIFGYPTSLGISAKKQLDVTKPLLRKGIIAGKNERNKTLILDCPVYYGNSGGPCVEVEEIDPGSRKFNLIGVVSEFVPFEKKWINIRQGLVNTEIENSGYSIVEPMDAVLDLVRNQEK
ncbi:MAG: trypsin-like peptidase domain-containing protein [Candidatus Omnitrophica bacterium]|nr:trypsin-like peptidase domain-containing protein [Candidatus Omnitrophota bacterium]